MSSKHEIKRWRENYRKEIDGAALYRLLAQRETDPRLREVYTRLAQSEEKHAEFWARKLTDAGVKTPAPTPSGQARVLMQLARWMGPSFIVPTLAQRETADQNAYDRQEDARSVKMGGDERSHAKMLRVIAGEPVAGGVEGGTLARLEGRHRAVGGNALRAAVLGANDGLVSNMSLIMGVAGATFDAKAVLVAGLAGLLAGASSMAMGEWLSVQSSRELHQRQIEIEAAELEESPAEEMEELTLIYQAKGLSRTHAEAVAQGLMRNPAQMLDTLVREELGVDPEELGGSAWEAAITSFILFAVGAIIPVLPFFFMKDITAIIASLIAGTIGLFGIGAAITLLTGKSVWMSGLRQLAIGLGAAGLTFGIGKLIGVSIAG